MSVIFSLIKKPDARKKKGTAILQKQLLTNIDRVLLMDVKGYKCIVTTSSEQKNLK